MASGLATGCGFDGSELAVTQPPPALPSRCTGKLNPDPAAESRCAASSATGAEDERVKL